MHIRTLFTALILGLVTTIAPAQFPPPPQPLPAPGPLMYLRFTGPKGAKITVYRGSDEGKTLELPTTLGFRPGYSYRLAVFDLPGLPRQTFFPSLDVRGTLALTPKARNADFPATIQFHEEDFEKAAAGTFIKKVVALERPDQATPIATKADEPLEFPVTGSRDVYVEAAQRGEPLVVFSLGQRVLSPQELNFYAIPGTILLPGDKVLGTPKVPPYLVWKWCQVYDPIHGPRHPSEFTAIYDGGDSGPQAGFDGRGRLKGLDPTDTIAEYIDSKGNKKLAASNRVALCVPRFIVFKSEMKQAMQSAVHNTKDALIVHVPTVASGQAALKQEKQQTSPEAIGTRMRLSGTFNTQGTSVTGRALGLQVKSNLRSPESVDASMAGPKQVEPDDGPLLIIKWPDNTCVNVGDIVTFYLKYSNTGGQPITNVVVSDSLAARFEYVKGSTKTDRDALFTAQPNEVGAAVLRWEFTGPLQPREHGLITFQVRVR